MLMGAEASCIGSVTLNFRYRCRIGRARGLPKCAACAASILAPASALRADGTVSYLSSCHCCGQRVVTNAA
jgi:hypothetical protein